MKQICRRALALLMLSALLLTPALAAEENSAPSPAPWAYDSLCEAEALNLLTEEDTASLWQPVTQEKLNAMLAIVRTRLAQLNLPAAQPDGTALVLDLTRGGVINALYQELASYQMDGLPAEPAACMQALGVLLGCGPEGLLLERPCTLQEALVFCQRLIVSVYDRMNAGSLGLLWKATGGGNTLYLLGTVHTDRDSIYPMHRQLREALLSAQTLYLELDFGDTAGIQDFIRMQTYSDGTGLRDHISPELFQQVAEAMAPLGLTEEQVNSYKPWALANTLSTLSAADESTGDSFMPMDTYFYSKAVMNGIPVAGVETYAFQGSLFDNLSEAYQENYLKASLIQYQTGEADENIQAISAMVDAWKRRDTAAFAQVYDKDAAAASGDELGAVLFAGRDPNMTAAADRLLKTEGENTFFLAVGAGHMVGATGIVESLRALGYTVELVPAA